MREAKALPMTGFMFLTSWAIGLIKMLIFPRILQMRIYETQKLLKSVTLSLAWIPLFCLCANAIALESDSVIGWDFSRLDESKLVLGQTSYEDIKTISLPYVSHERTISVEDKKAGQVVKERNGLEFHPGSLEIDNVRVERARGKLKIIQALFKKYQNENLEIEKSYLFIFFNGKLCTYLFKSVSNEKIHWDQTIMNRLELEKTPEDEIVKTLGPPDGRETFPLAPEGTMKLVYETVEKGRVNLFLDSNRHLALIVQGEIHVPELDLSQSFLRGGGGGPN